MDTECSREETRREKGTEEFILERKHVERRRQKKTF
jgi:hypothetical protein